MLPNFGLIFTKSAYKEKNNEKNIRLEVKLEGCCCYQHPSKWESPPGRYSSRIKKGRFCIMQSSGEIGGQSIKQLKNKDCTSNERRVL
jgi:hypothetical protein